MARIIHRTGYFERPAETWDLVEFLEYAIKHHPELTRRCILNRWTRTLSAVAKCRCPQACCSASDRSQAKTLRGLYRARGPRSHRRTATEFLRNQQAPKPSQPPPLTINNNFSHGSNHGNNVNIISSGGSASTHSVSNPVPDVAREAPVSTLGGLSAPSSLDRATTPLSDDAAYDSSSTTLSGRVWDSFDHSFVAFDDELKWRLPSGKTVEDTIHDSLAEDRLSATQQSMLHNWILDVSSPKVKALFSKGDWAAIEACVPRLPAVNKEFEQFLGRFSGVKTVSALQDVIYDTPIRCLAAHDEALLSDIEWARCVVSQFLRLWKSECKPFSSTHLEDWYTNNIWCRLLDDCLLTLQHVHLERKEVACQSSSLRRNRKREDAADRQKSAPRLDGLLRGNHDTSHEFCAIEAAPSLPCGPMSTKWLRDRLKLVIVLRDMLCRLISVSGHDAAVVQHLQVVGISFAGRSMQPMRLCHPGKGYVTLLVSDPLRTVPSDCGQLRDLVDLLPSILGLRGVLRATIEAFHGRDGNGSRARRADSATACIPEQPSPADGF